MTVVKSLEEAYAAAESQEENPENAKCFVIGGAYTYAEAMETADTLYITHVHDKPEDADAWEAGLRSVLEDAGLREKLAEEAKRRSGNYTWQKRAGIFLNGRKHA